MMMPGTLAQCCFKELSILCTVGQLYSCRIVSSASKYYSAVQQYSKQA